MASLRWIYHSEWPKYAALKTLVGQRTPDLQGRFLRGLDAEGSIDSERKGKPVGHLQADMIESHKHGGVVRRSRTTLYHMGANAHQHGTHSEVGVGDNHTPETFEHGGYETRPINVAVNFIIKY